MPVPVSSGTILDVNRKPNQNKPEPHPEPKPETLVPLPDAAPLLGLHYDTARKRLQAGTLRGEKHGGRWLVWVPLLESNNSPSVSPGNKYDTVSYFIPDVIPDDPEPIPGSKSEDSGPVPDQTGTESDALLVQLREEIAFLRQQVERQNHIIAGLIQRVPELPAGNSNPVEESPQQVVAADPTPDVQTLNTAQPAGWWRRVLAWLRGA